MVKLAKAATQWSKVKAKDNLARWAKVKTRAEVVGIEARELAKRLILADDNHGFLLASDDDAVTKTPEHHCGPSNLAYEETILLNAEKFSTSRYLGRLKGHESFEHATLPEALAVAGKDPRILVYALAASGRFVCLTRANFEWYEVLWYVFKG